ncbi:acyl-CoA Delta-9 desaturase [Arctopsyche grandis]|uniref:acyl-CoA Delta-9 desaturase n=1 Tax=Arctopsyche grandis TaxID=121162 RepID=UPI00406D98F7
MVEESSTEKALNRREANWPNVLFFIHIHLLSLHGLYLAFTDARLFTNIFCLFLVLCGLLGATCGAHRLWAHATYQANFGLKILLMILQTLVGQGSIYDWVVDHRLHHAHYGTDGDPYNCQKGFTFAHIYTHLQSLSPRQQKLTTEIDVSDLEKDSVVMFQKRFYWILYPIIFLLLPINAPVDYWGDSIMNSVFIMGFLRYALVINGSWLINSASIVWGLNPEDKNPAESNLVFVLNKSYWPQYHYLLPWDYKCGEFGSYGSGCSTNFIRVWAALGWATGLRTMEPDAIKGALSNFVSSGRTIVDCLKEAENLHPPAQDHFLSKSTAFN